MATRILLQDDEGEVEELDISGEHLAFGYLQSFEVVSIVAVCTEHLSLDYLTRIDVFIVFEKTRQLIVALHYEN